MRPHRRPRRPGLLSMHLRRLAPLRTCAAPVCAGARGAANGCFTHGKRPGSLRPVDHARRWLQGDVRFADPAGRHRKGSPRTLHRNRPKAGQPRPDPERSMAIFQGKLSNPSRNSVPSPASSAPMSSGAVRGWRSMSSLTCASAVPASMAALPGSRWPSA